jgi:hypothetical protein
MEGFNLMKVRWMIRNSTRFKSQIGLLLWRTKEIGLEKTLKRK